MANFIHSGLWQLKTLFGDGCMNFKIFFLKVAKLSGKAFDYSTNSGLEEQIY